MLVCPGCRNENVEDANFCRVCGRSLEPVGSYMRRADRSLEEEEAALDLPKARRSSPWPAIVAVVVVALGIGAWALFSLTRPAPPQPCVGKVSSPRYPYCTAERAEWEPTVGFNGGQLVDRFIHESDSAVAVVSVDEILVPSMSTAQYADRFRTSLRAEGINPSRTEVVRLGGEAAASWDYTVPLDGVPEPIAVRDILLVRPEGAYHIQFQAEEHARIEALVDFIELLRTWRWSA